MQKKILILIFMLTVLTATALTAQVTKIIGTVQLDDGTRLPGVTVTIRETLASTVTDKNGEFSFDRISPGILTVIATLPGLESGVRTTFVAAGTTTVISIVLTPAVVSAQVTKVIGTVQLDDGTRLPGVTVTIRETSASTVTDKNGEFSFDRISPGILTVIATLPGLESGVRTTFVAAGTTTVVSIVLTPAVISEKVEVSAQLPLLTATGKISEVVLTPTQITSLPSLGQRDIFRAFQLLPGVSGSQEASSGLYVRGGTPDQNLVLYDGFTIYNVNHLFGYFSAFNMNAIQDARLFKGGFEAKYGGRISSVTELTGTIGNEKKWGGSVGGGFLSADGHVEIPLFGKGSVFIAARRSFQSPLYNSIMNMFTENSLTGGARPGGARGGFMASFESTPTSYFYDLNAKANFHLSAKDTLTASLFNGRDNLDNSRTQDSSTMNMPMWAGSGMQISFKNNVSDLQEWGNTGIAALNWTRQWNQSIQTRFILTYSGYDNVRDRTVDMDINRVNPTTGETTEIFRQRGSIEDNNLTDLTARWQNEFQIGKSHLVEFGLQASSYRIRYNYETVEENSGETPFDPGQPLALQGILDSDNRGELTTAYVQDSWRLAQGRIIIAPGLRASKFGVTGETYIEPRFSLRWNVAGPFTLKGAWGRYYQFVNRVTREDLLEGNREFWALAGTSNVPVSSAVHTILGLSFETTSFLIDMEAYHKDLEGLSEFATRFRTPGEGQDYTQFIYSGTGTAEGIETLIQKKFGSYTGWISYTLGHVEYLFPDMSENPFPALHDSTHEFKLVNSYAWNKWTFAATWIYATGKPYTPLVGVEEVTLFEDRVMERPIMGEKNSARLPAYHRLDVSTTYSFDIGSAKTIAGLTLFNLYNRKNVWYKEFEIVQGELVENDFTYMGFTVNFFLEIRF